MGKRILAIILMLALLGGALLVPVSAAVQEGSYPIGYHFDTETGCLTIYGIYCSEGFVNPVRPNPNPDEPTGILPSPLQELEGIRTIFFADGVTAVCGGVLSYSTTVETVIFAASVTSLENGCIRDCPSQAGLFPG